MTAAPHRGDMHIRPYAAADWNELLRLVRLLFPDWQKEDEADLRATLAKSTGTVLVLERDDGGSRVTSRSASDR
jgi:hypothetical protein